MAPARIGRLNDTGEIESIALADDANAAELLKRYLTTPQHVAQLVANGDLHHLEDHGDHVTATWANAPRNPQTHADNNWPDTGQQCLYLHNDGIWWARRARTDGGWPTNWEPL